MILDKFSNPELFKKFLLFDVDDVLGVNYYYYFNELFSISVVLLFLLKLFCKDSDTLLELLLKVKDLFLKLSSITNDLNYLYVVSYIFLRRSISYFYF